jgi:hypothetical protein
MVIAKVDISYRKKAKKITKSHQTLQKKAFEVELKCAWVYTIILKLDVFAIKKFYSRSSKNKLTYSAVTRVKVIGSTLLTLIYLSKTYNLCLRLSTLIALYVNILIKNTFICPIPLIVC